jgi:hypothetical protein
VKGKAKAALALLALLLAVPGSSLELYLRRSVVLRVARPMVRDLVHVLPADAAAHALDAPLPFDVIRPMLLPAAEVGQAAAAAPGGDGGPVIVSGGRVALVPAVLSSPGVALLFRDLLEYLDGAERDRGGRVEIEVIDPPVADDYDAGLRKHFELRELGDLTEVSYPSLSGKPRSFRVRLARAAAGEAAAVATAAAPGAPDVPAPAVAPVAAATRTTQAAAMPAAQEPRELALRSGERIRIRFVRGAVTVTLPGRALRSAYSGDRVAVRPFDSEQSYDALVTGKREVLVELH